MIETLHTCFISSPELKSHRLIELPISLFQLTRVQSAIANAGETIQTMERELAVIEPELSFLCFAQELSAKEINI